MARMFVMRPSSGGVTPPPLGPDLTIYRAPLGLILPQETIQVPAPEIEGYRYIIVSCCVIPSYWLPDPNDPQSNSLNTYSAGFFWESTVNDSYGMTNSKAYANFDPLVVSDYSDGDMFECSVFNPYISQGDPNPDMAYVQIKNVSTENRGYAVGMNLRKVPLQL